VRAEKQQLEGVSGGFLVPRLQLPVKTATRLRLPRLQE
jgi:hypothetical protein